MVKIKYGQKKRIIKYSTNPTRQRTLSISRDKFKMVFVEIY